MIDYALSVRSTGLVIDVRLNDVPLLRDPIAAGLRDESFINEFMAAGQNQLLLRVGPPPGADDPADDAQAQADLLSVERGTDISAGTVLAHVEWTADSPPPPPRNYPVDVQAMCNVAAPDHRGWRNAPVMQLDPAVRRSVLKLLHELTDALNARQLDNVMKLLTTKVTERALAFAAAPADKLASLRANYADVMNNPNWAMAPWRDEDAIMELVGGNRMVKVTAADGGMLLKTEDLGGFRTAFPSDVSYVKGQWTILR